MALRVFHPTRKARRLPHDFEMSSKHSLVHPTPMLLYTPYSTYGHLIQILGEAPPRPMGKGPTGRKHKVLLAPYSRPLGVQTSGSAPVIHSWEVAEVDLETSHSQQVCQLKISVYEYSSVVPPHLHVHSYNCMATQEDGLT
jgi:hypothetical protein